MYFKYAIVVKLVLYKIQLLTGSFLMELSFYHEAINISEVTMES